MLFRTNYSNLLCTNEYWGQTHYDNGTFARLGVSARYMAGVAVELEGSCHGIDEDMVLF